MIAQRVITKNPSVISDEATVRAAVELLTKKQTSSAHRWVCEACGMVHSGSRPIECDSCGTDKSIAPLEYFPKELNSRW